MCISASRALGKGQPPSCCTSSSVMFNVTKYPEGSWSLIPASNTFNFSISRADQLKSNGMDLDFELCSIWAKRNWKVGEVKIDYYPRKFEDGRTMNIWISGFTALWVIIRERFSK